jgi:hypothetical protein
MKNEWGQDRGWLLFEDGFRIWRSMSICFLMLLACLFFNVFPVPLWKAPLIGDWHEKSCTEQDDLTYNPQILTWRTDPPCANNNSGLNTKKYVKHNLNIIGTPCLASIAYWQRGTLMRQYISAPMQPAPIVLAN